MQITADGFVARPDGQLDWMTFDMDDKLLAPNTRFQRPIPFRGNGPEPRR